MDKPIISRELEDGTRIELWQMLFNMRIMHVADGLHEPEIITQFCIRHPVKALIAAAT